MTDNELFFILTFACVGTLVSVWLLLYWGYRKEQQKAWLRCNDWRLYLGGWVSNRYEDRDSPIEILSLRKAVKEQLRRDRQQAHREWRDAHLPAPSQKEGR